MEGGTCQRTNLFMGGRVKGVWKRTMQFLVFKGGGGEKTLV